MPVVTRQGTIVGATSASMVTVVIVVNDSAGNDRHDYPGAQWGLHAWEERSIFLKSFSCS
jgi:hypothetical protein